MGFMDENYPCPRAIALVVFIHKSLATVLHNYATIEHVHIILADLVTSSISHAAPAGETR